MPAPRPFLNHTVGDLEKIFLSAHDDTKILRGLKAELAYRKTNKAAVLLTAVQQHLEKAQTTKSPTQRTVKSPSTVVQTPSASAVSKPIPVDPATTTVQLSPPARVSTDNMDRSGNDDGDPPLPPHLKEFILAIKEEIEAAKKNIGGNASLLSDGRLVAPVGGGFHYRFQSQRPLRVPPDTPGFLAMAGSYEDIPVSVIEIEDLSIVLELPTHIGVLLPQAKLKTDLTMLLLKLIERIETKGINHHPAADRALGLSCSSVSALRFDAFNSQMNSEQRLAVGNVLGSDTVFIWGPPGTGKTQTIGEIGAQLFQRGSTLLIASHTNTAVDEALLRIAKALEGRFDEGAVLRLGEPVKAELQNRPDLILKCVAEKRSEELKQQKKTAEETKAITLRQLESINRRVEICQWIQDTDSDCNSFDQRHRSIIADEEKAREMSESLTQSANKKELWKEERASAAECLSKAKALINIEIEISAWLRRLECIRQEGERKKSELKQVESFWPRAKQANPHRERLKSLPALSSARSTASLSRAFSDQARQVHEAKITQLKDARELLQQTLSVGAIKRMWLKLPKPEEQEAIVKRLAVEAESSLQTLASAEQEKSTCEAQLADISELTALVDSFADVPMLSEVEASLRSLIDRSRQIEDEEKSAQAQYDLQKQKHSILLAQISQFATSKGASAEVIFAKADESLASLESLEFEMMILRRKVFLEKRQLASDLTDLVKVLTAWNLCKYLGDSEAELMAALSTARLAAQSEVGNEDLNSLVTERDRLSALVAQLIDEIRSIEEALKKVEADLLANVQILATTLTRSFMRDGIQQRSFDTVLVDEASMAPIPALWAVATLCERCIVAVGDFKQLPPIVQSEHPIAKRWLGRDIFAASGVQGAWERGAPPSHFVALREQHRMHPDISAIVNTLIYDNLLRDGDTVKKASADEEVEKWHADFVRQSDRVTIIDMGSANAWNTTADRSRFNLLSAMFSMELIHHWLAPQRSFLPEGSPKRILVICPYRPQAKLLDVMVREDGLEIEVSANTAHSFQGSEADAVLIDLVADEPHYNSNLLAPVASENIARLLNVAITRAKRKVCILADMSWFRSKGRGAFVGGSLLPWVSERHPIKSALEAIAEVSSRDEDHTVISSSETATLLLRTIAEASRQVIVFSPSLSIAVVSELAMLRLSQRFSGYIVTQPYEEQGANTDDHRQAESLLIAAGYRVIHKAKMVDKLAIIDGSDVWCSSFGLLGPTPRQGFCVRRRSRKFAAEVSDFYFIEKLIAPYLEGSHLCPICAKEMRAVDSPKEKPFYWSCAERGCYTRDLESSAPVDGLLTFRCESRPEFGYWGSTAVWLCTCGQTPSHRIKIHKNHLRLPKMKALVPPRSWNKVCRDLGLSTE